MEKERKKGRDESGNKGRIHRRDKTRVETGRGDTETNLKVANNRKGNRWKS